MNRQLLVTLLHKNIEELGMISESLKEPGDLPQAIILLAKRKTEDIQTILGELSVAAANITSQTHADTVTGFVPEEKAPEVVSVAEEQHTDTVSERKAIPVTEITVPEPVAETVVEVNEVTPVEINPEEETAQITDNAEPSVEIEEDLTEVIDIDELPVTDEPETIQQSEEQTAPPAAETTQETTLHESKVMTIADKIATQSGSSRNESMSGSDNSLSASIANKKITDIKQAISIGDRFRFQRELFRSNGEDMNKTLTYLNLLATLDEAMAFLNSKYGWGPENEAAEDFYQIVKRKFL